MCPNFNFVQRTVSKFFVSQRRFGRLPGRLHVNHSTKDFQLDNGTLWIDGVKQLKSNEFCINRVEEENYSKSTAGNFVAHYCVPDPCTTSGCIRKCYPASDMALVMKYYHDLSPISKCDEPHPKPLNLSLLRNPQNESINVESVLTIYSNSNITI